MPHFSALIPETYWSISAGYVETLIQTQREELSTGLMRLSYPSGENLLLSFLEGIQKTLYRCLDDKVEVIPRQTWLDVLDRASISVGFLGLPAEAMRLVRLVHETPVMELEQSTLTAQELAVRAERWTAAEEPSIVYVEAQGIQRYFAVAGCSPTLIDELSFTHGRPRFSTNTASFLQTMPQLDCQVKRYVSNRHHELWREYELRMAFNPLMRMLLSRFGELAGRVLTERLSDQLSTCIRQNGWNMALSRDGIVNRHYFDSLQDAAGAYLELFRRYRDEASPAIGLRVVDGIWRETVMKLDPYRRELLTHYIYEPLGPANVPGVVWR
jgi:hypothetical protein